MEKFPNRLQYVVDKVGNVKKLAQKSGVGASSISGYLKGENEPSFFKVISLAKAGFVYVEWLATGDGPRDKDRPPALSEGQTPYGTAGPGEIPSEFVYLPVFNIKASAGGGYVVETESIINVLAFRTAWIHMELRASPNDLYLIYVDGESMEPTLRPGDIVLIDKRDASFTREGVYVIRMDATLLVKRLQRLPGGMIDVTSDNPAYKPFQINQAAPSNEIEIVGRVVWVGRRM